MTAAQLMLDTHPTDLRIDVDVLAATIDALVDCATTCPSAPTPVSPSGTVISRPASG